MSKWMVSAKKADFTAIANACGISPVLARLIRNRGPVGVEETNLYLYGTMKDLTDPGRLHGIGDAVRILEEASFGEKKIRIIGDYDVDGICSSYILVRSFQKCGADADVVLPDRVKDGYGINERIVREAYEDRREVIITCDNGIAAVEPLRLAKELGLTVIVTDHHEIPFKTDADGNKQFILPPADTIVNPKMTDTESGETYYPFPEICGAFVAFKLSQLLIRNSKNMDDTEKEELLRELTAFAGMATICDVMPLQNENRILVRNALREAAITRNAGLRALLRVTGLADTELTCYHVGFVIGPCLNATGRLHSAMMALDLFREKNNEEALRKAQELKDLNESRKDMTRKGVDAAGEQVISEGLAGNKVLVLLLENFHESLAGIIAGRIKEYYNRPVFVLIKTKDGLAKGSGRSVEAYDMYSEMSACENLLVKFGGHKMAAGLTIEEKNVNAFRKALNENCLLTDSDFEKTVHIDMELPPRFITMDMMREFALLEPCGNENDRVLFVTRNITIRNMRVLGIGKNVLRFSAVDEEMNRYTLIRFEDVQRFGKRFEKAGKTRQFEELLNGYGEARIDMVYYPEINRWNGRETMQLIMQDLRIRD